MASRLHVSSGLALVWRGQRAQLTQKRGGCASLCVQKRTLSLTQGAQTKQQVDDITAKHEQTLYHAALQQMVTSLRRGACARGVRSGHAFRGHPWV
jgi:hypothetical protein